MQRFATGALFAVIAAAGVGAASAQTVPEGYSCGGLLCDMGVLGHKTEPAAAAVPPATPTQPAGMKTAGMTPAPALDEPRKLPPHKKKRIAKAKAAPVQTAKAPMAAPAQQPVVAVARPMAPEKSRPAAQMVATPVAAPAAPAPAVAANPAPVAGGAAILNPYGSAAPAPAFRFRPIY